jgi:hypothetical protein
MTVAFSIPKETANNTPISKGYEAAKGRHIFRDFIAVVGLITLPDNENMVRYQKHTHHPLLIEASFANTDGSIPWLGDKRFRLVFG